MIVMMMMMIIIIIIIIISPLSQYKSKSYIF